ncbi:phosphatase PAP2 family protein [Brucella anthropi]|uniref:Phosphatase PAP2 family protein n=1 Tax=Brucella anthropi TaxID=529 RepID=A0A6I0DHC7_BRUAN|nr:phosphatase PAP2 family protein [Brucella anthropi]KAB2788953.1 phosphatase PAP2 family protein [Brucella anthropi]
MPRFLTLPGRVAPLTLALVTAICAGLVVMERLTSEVLEHETHHWDEAILLGLRHADDLSLPIGPPWILHAVRDVNSLGGVTVLAIMTVLATIFLLISRRRAMALYMLVSLMGGWAISNALKFGVARPRPTIVPHLMDVYDPSFPSGHAMMSAVTYLTIAALVSQGNIRGATRAFFLATALMLTFAIGLCRIYLGVHYPTDVLAGWCVGSLWALCCYAVGRKYIGSGFNNDVVTLDR